MIPGRRVTIGEVLLYTVVQMWEGVSVGYEKKADFNRSASANRRVQCDGFCTP